MTDNIDIMLSDAFALSYLQDFLLLRLRPPTVRCSIFSVSLTFYSNFSLPKNLDYLAFKTIVCPGIVNGSGSRIMSEFQHP